MEKENIHHNKDNVRKKKQIDVIGMHVGIGRCDRELVIENV